jgi:uncharacterized GH25 family protein
MIARMKRASAVLLIAIVAAAIWFAFSERSLRREPTAPPEAGRNEQGRPDAEPAEPANGPGSLEVLVIDSFDRPLEGCRVEAAAVPEGGAATYERDARFRLPAPVATARTGADGRAVLTLSREREWRISADRPGTHARATRWTHAPGRLTLRLVRGVVLRGTVLSSDAPAAGARVAFGSWMAGVSATVVALATGGFELTVPEVPGVLDIDWRGRVYSFEIEPFYGEPRTFRLGDRVGISGTVRDEGGAPIAGAQIRVESDAVFVRASTDAEGRFAVPDLPTGRPKLTVFAEGFAPHLPHPVAPPAELDPGEQRTVEIVLGKGTRVTGRVVDAGTGVPLPGAEVRASSDLQERIPPHIVVKADERGCFELRATPDRPLDLAVRSEGHCLSIGWREKLVSSVPAEDLDLGDVKVPRTVTLTGRVLGIDGTPRPGVEVSVGDGVWPSRTHRTDADGRFSAPGLDPTGMAHVGLTDPFWGHFILFPGRPSPESFDLRPPAPVALEGKVTLREEPLRGATVRATVLVPPDCVVGIAGVGRTGPDGRYRLPRLTNVEYLVEVIHPRAKPWSKEIELPAPDGATPLDVELSPADPSAESETGLTIEGVVRSEDDRPVPGITMEIRNTSGHRDWRTSDTEGRFLFENLPPGTYRLRTRLEDDSPWVHAEGDIEAGDTEVVVRLRRAHVLKATVRLPSGEPCPAAAARVTQGEFVRKGRVRDGSLAIKGLPAGAYELTIDAHGYRPIVENVTLPGAPLVLRLRTGGVIQGMVLGPDGKPVAGAKVSAVVLEENVFYGSVTDAEGRFRIQGLPERTYDVYAGARDAEGREYGVGPVPVRTGADPVTLTLKARPE